MAEKVVSIKLEAKVEAFAASMRKAKASVDDLTKADVQKPAKAFDSLASKAAIGGAVLAVGVGKAVKSFADFEAAMSAASAALPEAGAQMDSLRQLAVTMGKDTQFSATEAAQGITEMAKAGVDAKQIMGGGLKGALDLAAAGQINVGDAGEIAATALNQFNLEGGKLPHVADLYAAAAGKAQGSVTDVANAMKYAGVTASSMGISIEETTGVIGLFASKGIIGEQAGTSFRSMLLSLTSPSVMAKGVMDDLGISVYDSSGKFIGMQAAAQVLKDKLGPLDEATRNQALGQIFGNESMGAAIALYQAGGSGVADWTKKVDDAGFASKQASKLTDNLKGDLERLSGSIETVFIQAGSGANDTLRALAQGAGSVVDYLGKIPGPVLLVGTAIGSLALLAPKGITAFRNYQKQLDTLGISFDKIAAKAPRTAKGIQMAGKAAGVLAVAATAVYAFAGAADKLNADKLGADLSNTSDGLALINKELADSTSNGWGRVGSDIDSFGKALGASFDPGVINNIDNAIGSFKTIFGGENVSNIQNAAKQIGGIDQALSALVAGGKVDQAKAVFAQMTTVAAAQGISVEDLQKKFPLYAAAVANAGNAASTTAPKMGELSQDVQDVEKKADDAKDALDKLREAIEGFGSPLAAQRAAQRDYNDAVRGASEGLKSYTDDLIKHRLESQKIDPEKASKKQKAAAADWAAAQVTAGKALDVTTEAGAKNQAALDGIRDKTLKAASETFNLTHSQELAAAEVSKGRDAFIKAAVAAGMNADKAAELARNLGLVPKDVKTAIGLSGVPTTKAQLDTVTGKVTTLDNKTAKPAVKAQINKSTFDAAEARIDQLARSRSAQITVNVGLSGPGVAALRASQERRHPNVVFATGGAVSGPGTGTSDSIPALLSNGEHVLTAAEVTKAGGQAAVYRMRKAINAGLVKFAQGGAVGYATGGAVKAPLDTFYSDYNSRLGNKVSAADLAGNRKAIADATTKLRLAEMKLEEDRRKKKRNPRQIAADEAAVANARDAVTTATTRASNAQAAYNRQQESALSKFGKGVRSGVRNTASFIANIQKLASRGFVSLAQNLANMNNEDAEKIAAQAAGASNATLGGLEQQVTTAAGQQAKLDHIDTITSILGQVRTKNLTARQMAAATGIDLEEILTAAALIKGDLSKNKNSSKLLADLAKWSKGQLFSVGGAVAGGGTGTSDSIPAWLSNGEHILTAREVAAAGGHSAIYALRKAILSGGVARHATGGPVGRLVSAPMMAPRFDYARLASLMSSGPGGPTFNAYGQDSEAAVQRAMRQYEFAQVSKL